MAVVGSAVKVTDGDFVEEFALIRQTDLYHVTVNSLDDTPAIVLVADGLPIFLEQHESDSRLKVRMRRPRRNADNRMLWEVNIEYEGLRTGPDIPDPAELASGIEWLPDVQWDGEESLKEVYEDIEGDQILNPCGERYDPPPSDTYEDPVLTISRLEPSFDIDLHQIYVGKLNADVFWGAAPGKCRCRKIRSGLTVVQNLIVWRVQYVFVFRMDSTAWKLRIAKRGTRMLDGGKLRRIKYSDLGSTDANEMNEIVSEPVNLDDDGTPLADQTQTKWDERDIRQQIEFAPLNLDFPAIAQQWREKLNREIYGSY